MASASMATPIEIEDFVALSPAPPAVADSADGASDVEHGEVPTNMTPRSPMAVAAAPQTTQTALEPHEPGAATQPTGIDHDQSSDGELDTNRELGTCDVILVLGRIMDFIEKSNNAATAHHNSTADMQRIRGTIVTILSSLEAMMGNIETKMDNIGAMVDSLGAMVEKLGAKVDNMGAKVDSIRAKVDTIVLGRIIDLIDESNDAATAHHNKSIADMQRILGTSVTRLSSLEAKMDNIETKVDIIGAKLDIIGAKLDIIGVKEDNIGTKMDNYMA